MGLIAKERIVLEDGLHKGVIVAVEYREKPYEYVDFVIETDEGKLKLKASYSQFLSAESKLGLMLQRFGVNFKAGDNVEPEILIGRKCQFITIKKDKYANISNDSVRPAQ